ncbi:MAG: LysM peptidoglycan-binding domain-containing protein [Rhodoferax sp.]|jgi:tetratricopeptide (TPR) repeat protein|nr:LysM peptidoglycan-binding domain-containing protein [Rhodoferax sp.]MCL4739362.1 LysM peptidoglycan-binding domain-containing protein [Burkholderiaceae bacterium]
MHHGAHDDPDCLAHGVARRFGASSRWAVLAVIVGLSMLAGCEQPPRRADQPPVPPSVQLEPPAAEPELEPMPAPEPPVPGIVLGPQEVPGAVTRAIEMLEAGEVQPAEELLDAVLRADPAHRRAQSLLRQIREDPRSLLGSESFAHRVLPGESLSLIAQRFLKDPLLFYALARYNDIAVPRQLAGGQVIRVPGKAPAPGRETEPVPMATPTATPTPPPATPATPPVAAERPAAPPAPPPPVARPPEPDPQAVAAAQAARAARDREAAVARHIREARSAFAKQDLEGAIREWNEVLKIDPDNRTAQLERQKAVELQERLRRLK